MTTITAEALGLNLTDEFYQALKKGVLFVQLEGRTLRIEEVDRAQSEEELKRAWDKARADQAQGRLQRTNNPDELLALLDSF